MSPLPGGPTGRATIVETDAVFPHGYRFADGYLHPAETPGLGVDIDEAEAARHPYRAASLPVARLGDGSLHSW